MIKEHWMEVHEWRKRNDWYRRQRQQAADWWRMQRGTNDLTRARARRARRFIKAHHLSMVDPLLVEVVSIEFFLRDANRVGERTRRLFQRFRKPHPGAFPKAVKRRA